MNAGPPKSIDDAMRMPGLRLAVGDEVRAAMRFGNGTRRPGDAPFGRRRAGAGTGDVSGRSRWRKSIYLTAYHHASDEDRPARIAGERVICG